MKLQKAGMNKLHEAGYSNIKVSIIEIKNKTNQSFIFSVNLHNLKYMLIKPIQTFTYISIEVQISEKENLTS